MVILKCNCPNLIKKNKTKTTAKPTFLTLKRFTTLLVYGFGKQVNFRTTHDLVDVVVISFALCVDSLGLAILLPPPPPEKKKSVTQ